MKKFALSGVLVLLTVISSVGCGSRYMVGKESFGSASEALNRQAEINSQVLEEITATDKPAHGTVLVIYPSDAEIQKNYIRYGSNASKLGKENIDYLIAFTRNTYQCVADGIRKRELFDRVSVERHNGNPASYPIGNFDFLVFADIDGWFIKSKDKPEPELINYNIHRNPLVGFLDYLGLQAKELRGK